MRSELQARLANLTDQAYMAARTAEVQCILEIVGLLMEDAKDTIIVCDLAKVSEIRGEIAAYQKIIKRVTLPSVASRIMKENI